MEMRDFFLLYQDKHEALGTSHAYTGPPAYEGTWPIPKHIAAQSMFSKYDYHIYPF